MDNPASKTCIPSFLFKIFLVTLGFHHFSKASVTVTAATLILSVGDRCDISSSKRETVKDLEIVNGTVFGFTDPPICDPSMPLECISGKCQCKRGFTISRNGTKCLEISRNGLDSQCEESIQCWKGLLGRLSECSNGKCRCYESQSLPIVFHQGRCLYGESLGDFCQIEGLCAATTPNAECRATTCQCEEGYVPSWDKSNCLKIATQLNSPCIENVQCEKSGLGTLSECNQESMTCQCYQIPMVPTVFYMDRCYFGAALNDVCQVNPQCSAKTEQSICGKDGKCHCDEGWIENGNQTKCLRIPADASSSAPGSADCVEDVQCTKALGYFAHCDPIKRKCECYIPQDHGRRENETTFTAPLTTELSEYAVTPMVIIGSRCQSVKYLGESCKFNKQCSTPTSNSVCYNGICECNESHVPSEDGRKCLERATGINSQCDEDLQCIKSSLGPLSRCNKSKKKCECSKHLPVVYYDKKCYFHRQLGSPCESSTECIAGGNYLLECREGRCRCKSGSEQFTDHSCIHLSSGSSSVILRHFHFSFQTSLITLMWMGKLADM